MQPRDIAAYSFLAVAWGLSFLLLLKVVEAFGWIGAVTFRCFIAGAILLVVARLLRKRLIFSARWFHFAAVGATTVAGQLIGLSYSAPLIGTAMSAIFVAAIPMFSMLIGQIWGLERITRPRLFGILTGATGIIMLVGFPAVPVDKTFILGCIGMIFSTFSAALGSNYASRHLNTVGSFEVTIGAFLFGGLLTLPLLAFVPVPGWPRPVDYLYLVALAGLMSALTYVIYFALVTRIGATRAISVEFSVTVVAVAVGAGLLGEKLSVLQYGGAAVIILGCAIVLGLMPPPWRRLA
ncbi:DMT family transporter [Rhizobium halophytocola]|uniref:Drug/metabolite transporter (DMT)-like permease n=1 Tax=Rhizobium halophytocola TaxID=735519 RepID=A0ABS4DYL6_9HYPH|nr:DMT family transporter [Rhizobium halophytocola]MBP1850784.1 drug/metabolite transporter (DMT)-like permease [Rhizobium halophytocola]